MNRATLAIDLCFHPAGGPAGWDAVLHALRGWLPGFRPDEVDRLSDQDWRGTEPWSEQRWGGRLAVGLAGPSRFAWTLFHTAAGTAITVARHRDEVRLAVAMPPPAADTVTLLLDLLRRLPTPPELALVYDPESPEDGELRMQGMRELADLPPVLYLGAEAARAVGGVDRARKAPALGVAEHAGGVVLRARSSVLDPPTRQERQRLRRLRRYLGISAVTPLRLARQAAGRPSQRWRLERHWAETLEPGLAVCGVWCESVASAWAVGQAGTALRWDGSAWSPVPTPTRQTLNAVWAAPLDQLETAIAVGEAGTVLRWGGDAWAEEPAPTRRELRGVWGSGPGDVWAVGDGGTVLRGNGRSWRPVDVGTAASLSGVWGGGPDDVWVVGAGGLVAHWDGGRWVRATTGASEDLCAVWADTPGQPWAVGRGGVALRLADGSWQRVQVEPAAFLRGVWGGPGGVWAVGDGSAIRRWDGRAFTVPPGGLTAQGDGERLLGVHGDERGRVWIVGEANCVLSVAPDGEASSGGIAGSAG